MTHYLQQVQAADEHKRQDDHQHARDQRALIEKALLAPVVLDATGGHA
jgi:hypothetical protein